MTKEIKKVRDRLKTALLRKDGFEEKHKGGNKILSKREQGHKEKIWDDVDRLREALEALLQERDNTTKEVSKIEDLIDQGYQKLDTNTKDFMDAIKILARNIFYLSFQSFKEKYDNYRDDHVLFRHLTLSPGYIEPTENNLRIWLTPQMEYPPKLKKIITQVMQEINETKPDIPDGSGRKIELLLKN